MQKKRFDQLPTGNEDSAEGLSIIAEFARELSRGKKPECLTRVLGLLCDIFEAPHGLIALKSEDYGKPAILAVYTKKQRNIYQFKPSQEILQFLIKHSPPLLAGNMLWIRDLAIEDRAPKLVSVCDRVLSFSLVFEKQDFGRVFIFLEAKAKPTDDRLAVSEILIDILSLYCSQNFSSARDDYARTASLRRITSLINSTYTMDETLRAIGLEMKKSIDCRACWALLPSKSTLYSIVQIGRNQNFVDWSFDQIEQDKAKNWINKCASPLLLASIEVNQNLGKDARLPMAEDELSLVIPIRSRNVPLGLFSLILPSNLDFKEIWPLIEEIEGPISAAISNADLFQSERTMKEQLARSNRRLEEANKEIANLYSNLQKLYVQLGAKLAELLEDQIEIVLFTSQDCVHCSAAERVTQETLRLYKGQVSYRKVDIQSESSVWKGKKIKSVPAIAIGEELLLGVPDPTRIHTCLFNALLPLIRSAH